MSILRSFCFGRIEEDRESVMLTCLHMLVGSVLSNTDAVLFYIRQELEDPYRRVEEDQRWNDFFSVIDLLPCRRRAVRY